MTFSLATILLAGAPTPVLVLDGRYYRIAELAPEVLAPDPSAGLMTVLAHWAEAEPVLVEAGRALAEGDRTAAVAKPPNRLEDWLTPLRYPSKVICTGANYYDHMTKDGGHTDFSK